MTKVRKIALWTTCMQGRINQWHTQMGKSPKKKISYRVQKFYSLNFPNKIEKGTLQGHAPIKKALLCW